MILLGDFTAKRNKFLKYRDLLACVVVRNSCEITWFLKPESKRPKTQPVITTFAHAQPFARCVGLVTDCP